MLQRVFPAISVDTTGLATESKQDSQITELQGINTELNTITGHVDGLEALITSTNTKIDTTNSKLDTLTVTAEKLSAFQTSALIDTSSTNIPGSAGSPLTLIASTSAQTLKVQIVEDIGSYMGLYVGAAASEVLVAALPLGGGEVEVDIPAASRLSLKALETPAISSGKIIVNLLG